MHTIGRYIVGAGALIGLGIALQPVLAEPEVMRIAKSVAEIMLLSGGAGGLTLGIGYVHHRLMMWASERPVMPSPSALYAVVQQHGPEIAGQVARLQAEERREETDEERQWHNRIVKLCVIATAWHGGSFAWSELRGHTDRYGWGCITKALAGFDAVQIGSGTRPTMWREGWTVGRVREGLKRGSLCPSLPEREMPEVRW